jgi:hypothetical protein
MYLDNPGFFLLFLDISSLSEESDGVYEILYRFISQSSFASEHLSVSKGR